MNIQLIAVLAIFAGVYFAITTELVNKTAAALLGAMLVVLLKVMDQESAFRAIDWNVIFLLIGMMIITGVAKRTGLFQWIAIKAAKLARGEPVAVLLLLSVVTAVISAFLDNVTTVLIVVPIAILIAVELGTSPVPFVIALAIASNVGGTATLIGDPPNIMIGSAAGISFSAFMANNGPVILVSLAAFCVFAIVAFRGKLRVTNERKARIMEFDESKAIEDKPLLMQTLVVLGLVIAGFLVHGALGLEPSTIAMAGAALLLVVTRFDDVEGVLAEMEWSTILFFMGLFIIVEGLVEVGVMGTLSAKLLAATSGHASLTMYVVLWASGIISAFVDNIPFVATMIPLIKDLGSGMGSAAVEPLWWALSLGACLGGNGTIIGASANVVSVGLARKSGYAIGFKEFFKYGSLFMVITLAISSAFLALRW